MASRTSWLARFSRFTVGTKHTHIGGGRVAPQPMVEVQAVVHMPGHSAHGRALRIYITPMQADNYARQIQQCAAEVREIEARGQR